MREFLVVVRNLNQNSVLVLRSFTSERSTAVFYFESCDWHIHSNTYKRMEAELARLPIPLVRYVNQGNATIFINLGNLAVWFFHE